MERIDPQLSRHAALSVVVALLVQLADYAYHGDLALPVAPKAKDTSQTCCGVNHQAPCPHSWTLVSPASPVHGGLDELERARQGEATCRWRESTPNRVQCRAPPDYTGPCPRVLSPPCDLSERTGVWQHVCGVQWPCREVSTCDWQKCGRPQCFYRDPYPGTVHSFSAPEDAAPANNVTALPCAGHLVLVMQIPGRYSKFSIARRIEFVETLYCNLNNPAVKEVHLLLEHGTALVNATANMLADIIVQEGVPCADASGAAPLYNVDPCSKLRIVPFPRRLTFLGGMQYISNRTGMHLLLNADISVGEQPSEAALGTIFDNAPRHLLIPLTRYESDTCSNYKKANERACDCRSSSGWCLDAYAMRAPLPPAVLRSDPAPDGRLADIDFPMGAIMGGENVFLENMVYRGMSVQSMTYPPLPSSPTTPFPSSQTAVA